MLFTCLKGGHAAWLVILLVVMFVAPVALAEVDVAYASPMATPAVATVTTPQSIIPDDTVRRPDGPSSLALLAIGLACLYFVRSRQWVR